MSIQDETNSPVTPHGQVSPTRGWLGVAAITASLFIFLTTELMPIGLLTPLSASLGVSVGSVGLMVTAQGLAAGLGVPFIVAWTRRVNRRRLLTTLLAVLAVGNLITSIAPNYPLILGTRLIMGFASGVFWAIGVSMAMIPSLPSANAVSVREVFELPVRNVPLRLVLVMVVFFVLGHFGAYTFVRPCLEDSTSATVGFITVVLIVFGTGGAIGNFIGGQTVNKSLRGSFIVGGLIMIAAMILWGLAFGVVQLSQINMTLSAAPETFEAAMSLNTMAYNTCIALGALIGGLFADHVGVTSVVWFGIVLVALAVILRASTGRRTTPAI
ncbi:MFS transporter [Streptomyces niveus]|uniref:MFS transporter n=1 Tax=Streptomyces niveus TaxID=193462 RepID=UPI003429E88F